MYEKGLVSGQQSGYPAGRNNGWLGDRKDNQVVMRPDGLNFAFWGRGMLLGFYSVK